MKECLIYGIFGGFIGSLYMGWLISSKSPNSKNPSLAIVDMQALILKKSQQLATTIMSTNTPQQTANNIVPVREAATQLKDDLNTFATNHNLILLSKAAVVSGDVPDKTDEILDIIERGDNS